MPARQREKRPGGGASGQRLGNRPGACGGGADCPCVPSGLAASVKSGTGGLVGGSRTICGGCDLRADLTRFFDGLLASFCGGFSGGITGVASGESSAATPRPVGSFSDSTHRKKVSLSSSIAAHPARPKLADTVNKTSATRAKVPVGVLVIGRVGASSSAFGADARLAPYGCRAVNAERARAAGCSRKPA
jgi:hypothetical protein